MVYEVSRGSSVSYVFGNMQCSMTFGGRRGRGWVALNVAGYRAGLSVLVKRIGHEIIVESNKQFEASAWQAYR